MNLAYWNVLDAFETSQIGLLLAKTLISVLLKNNHRLQNKTEYRSIDKDGFVDAIPEQG